MAENTNIEWCDHSQNFWTGCEAISPGCLNCYAAAWAKRAGRDFSVRTHTTKDNRNKPVKWNAAHDKFFAEHGRRQRVFTNSLADVFDNQVPTIWRAMMFDVMRKTPNLDWLVLTKRAGNIKGMLPEDWGQGYPNVWLGITVVNQEEADRDIPKLLSVPAAIHFLSCEPLLSKITLDDEWMCGEYYGHSDDCDNDRCAINGDQYSCPGQVLSSPSIDWLICGGESSPKARPMDKLWASSLRHQCAGAKVPFFMKQGSQANWPRFKDFESFPESLRVREWPKSALKPA